MSIDIAENLKSLKASIPAEVNLIAVSKTKSVNDILQAYNAGHRDFGENRIQEMASKYEQLPKDIRWHMIGHVQGNKIKFMAPFVHLVHGMDKPKRFKELNKEAAKHGRSIDCLLQVHIAREDSKFGFSFEEARDFLSQDLVSLYPNINVRGLMGMATFTQNSDQVQAEFEGLATFYNSLKHIPKLEHFNTLSMGMSGDYKIAIRAGSNMIRVGQMVFGARNTH